MIKNQEEDEFIAVRVQDPRVQGEGSWNSYVDFKIFLHTNSKSFTAKTSCVRRRYSEFVWLKKKLQKNSGLVPVPDLPSKSFFSFSNEDFLERRRKGLQCFLEKVLHMTVCLSDSQLHLFLQTQLPVGHILDCVQGHTPYTVTDAILTYASSNRGWAQEEDTVQEWSLSPVPYESMESPAPHQPTLPNEEPLTSASPTPTHPGAIQTLESIADIHDIDTVELQLNETESLSLAATREDSRAEAVLEMCSPVEASSAGDSQGESPPEKESMLAVERALKEDSPADVAEETVPHTEVIPGHSNHEETCHRDTLEKPVPDPVCHEDPTREDNRPGETGSVGDTNGAGRWDNGQGRGDETEYRTEINREEDDNTEAVLEEENGDCATPEKEKTQTEESEAVDGEEEEDEEMLPGGVQRQNEDPDGECNGETSSDGSSFEESATEDAGPEKTSRVTNGYPETTPEKQHRYADEADEEVCDADTPEAKTSEDPSLDYGSAEANDVREIMCVEVGENKEIVYMTNICPAITQDRMSSGLVEGTEEKNNLEIRDSNHLESSDEHCKDILLSVVPETEALVKRHEREVHEFTADASLAESRETEP